MNKSLSYILCLLCFFSFNKTQGQTVYSSVEEISFRESFHQNIKVNTDSTLVYVNYNGDYSFYEEYEGTVTKQLEGSFKMDLQLRKRLTSNDRHAPFQILFSVTPDSSYQEDLQLNIWYFDEEEIPVPIKFPVNSNSDVDTILNLKVNNGLLIYTPFWNPTNSDEIVHKVDWNKSPKWTLYKSETESKELFFKIEGDVIEFYDKD